jgi:MFS family permease
MEKRSAYNNVLLLAGCQALLLTNAVTLIAINALAGYALADNKSFATVPNTAYVLGMAATTYPASMLMKRIGRRSGFLLGAMLGLAGGLIATAAIALGSFPLLCAGSVLLGAYNAFGQYYRFAAADAAPSDFKAKAISYVLAGGLVGGIVGPEISKHTRAFAEPQFLATYGSLVIYSLLAMTVISMLRIPEGQSGESHEPARPLSQIAAQPAFLVAVCVSALGYAVMTFLMTATPLAMGFCGHPYSASATVIASHVVAMFAPSFFTGSLIKRFGVLQVILAGVAMMVACVAAALSGQDVASFWWALVLLGLGWNFMFIGGSTLLTETYRPSEKSKAQGTSELVTTIVQACAAFSSGVLVNARGWDLLNYIALPLILVAGTAALSLLVSRRIATRAAT